MSQTQELFIIRRLLPEALGGKDAYYCLKSDETGWTIDPLAAKLFPSQTDAINRLAKGVPDFLQDAKDPEVSKQWAD